MPRWWVLLGAATVLLAVGVGLFAYTYATTDIPGPGDFVEAEATTVYYADGETVMGSFAEYDRRIIALEGLPEHVGQAVIASEDRRFYENSGVDLRGIARALWNNLQGKPTQGGSTLTQQYVERYYMGTTTTYTGKFREAILAIKIDRSQPKDRVLEGYLNTIYFGRGTYGIERAAQAYFDKPATELTISESALLAGIIPAPSVWDPAISPDRAHRRWERVLDLMLADGWITAEEHASAQYPDVAERERSSLYAGPKGYLLDTVRSELLHTAGFTEEEIDTLGLRVVTTIDARAQRSAVAAVDALPEDRPAGNRVGMVSVDARSGAIVAMYGGPDFVTHSRNAATQDVAQAGSTFKPFALVAALERGASLYDTFPSYTPMEIPGYDAPVHNFDGLNRGAIDLVEATVNSVNTVYAQLNVGIGPQRTMDAAVRAGIPEDTAGLVATPSNVLGPASPHAIDMASAYATFAAQGVHHDPYMVAEVRDGEGEVRYTGGDRGTRVFDAEVTAAATYAMQQVVERGTGVRAALADRPAAGKTGSSNAYRSAWFVGFTPQLATAVAMYQVGDGGTEEVLEGFGHYPGTISGSTYPAELWRDFMDVATRGLPVEAFPEVSAQPRPRELPATPAPAPVPEQPSVPAPVPAPRLPQLERVPEPEPTPARPERAREPTQEEPTVDGPTAEAPEPGREGPTPEPSTEEPTPEPTPEPTEGPGPEEPTEEPRPERPAEEPTDQPGPSPANPEPAPEESTQGPPNENPPEAQPSPAPSDTTESEADPELPPERPQPSPEEETEPEREQPLPEESAEEPPESGDGGGSAQPPAPDPPERPREEESPMVEPQFPSESADASDGIGE